jgi:hypothetical protein
MSDGQAFELADGTYPLMVDGGVTIPEEIQCLLDAGWTWNGDKLVHPKDKDIWRMYQRVDSRRIGSERFNAEIEQAVQEARRQEQRMQSGGQ